MARIATPAPAPQAEPRAASHQPLWVVLRSWLFGYDFFISYSQEPATREYAAVLQAALAERDFVCFRDLSELHAGEALTPRIRSALRRTRVLIVLATRRSLTSDWVKKEVGLFAMRRRVILPIDLEGVMPSHPWPELRERVFLDDVLPRPSSAVVDDVARSFRGAKANRLARWTLGVLSVAAFVAGAVLSFQARQLSERATRLRTEALVSLARSNPDPLVSSLVLLEAADGGLPADAHSFARELAARPVPLAVLRAGNATPRALDYTADSRELVVLDDERDVRRWLADGRSDARWIGQLPWRPVRFAVSGAGANLVCLASSTEGLSLLRADGTVASAASPTAPEGSVQLEAGERWTRAALGTAWRWGEQADMAAFLHDAEHVALYSLAATISPLATLTFRGEAPLDVWIGPSAEGRRQVSVLCTSGLGFDLTIDDRGNVLGERRSFRIGEPGTGLTLQDDPCGQAFSPDGRRIVVLAEDETRVHVGQRGERGWTSQAFVTKSASKRMTVARDGGHALLTSENGDVSRLALADFTLVEQPWDTHVQLWSERDYQFGSGAISASATVERLNFEQSAIDRAGGAILLVAETVAWLWYPESPAAPTQLRTTFVFEESARPVFAPDGSTFATADRMGEVRVWSNTDAGREPLRLSSHLVVGSWAAHPTGGLLLATRDGEVLYRASPEAAPVTLAEPGAGPARVRLSPACRLAAASAADGRVRVWRVPSGEEVTGVASSPPNDDGKNGIASITFAGERFLVLDDDRSLRFCDLASAETRASWSQLPIAEYNHVAVPIDAPDAVVVMLAEAVEWWDLSEPARPRNRNRLQKSERPWSVSARAGVVAAGLDDGRILLWRPSEAESLAYLEAGDAGEEIMAVSVSPDGRSIAFGTSEGRAGILLVSGDEPPLWLEAPGLRHTAQDGKRTLAHIGVVNETTFSADGRWLSTAGAMDGAARVWNRDGQLVAQLPSGVVTAATFLDDGRLAMMMEPLGALIWLTQPEAVLQLLRSRTSATLLPDQRVRYLGETPEVSRERFRAQELAQGRSGDPGPYTTVDLRF